MNTDNLVSLVILMPIYEDVKASSILIHELSKELGKNIYVVIVDDGSVINPVNIDCIQNASLQGVILRLKRNVGHQRAIAIGLNYISENFKYFNQVIIMDSDGEDLPSSIRKLLLTFENTDADIVVAERKSRIESLRFRFFYEFYKWLFKLLSGKAISFGNFMVLKPNAVSRLVSMHELWMHVAASVISTKMRIAFCPLDRGPRYAGQSKMNFVSLALHGFRALMVFAEDVLVRVGIACAVVAALSVFFSIVAISLKLFSYPTPGWFSVALGILLLVFLQTGALTLMTLMLTGVVRGGMVTKIEYIELIDSFIYTTNDSEN